MEGRKILLGGTHQGGVQFLTDLTNLANPTNLNGNAHAFKQMPDNNQEQFKNPIPSEQVIFSGLLNGKTSEKQEKNRDLIVNDQENPYFVKQEVRNDLPAIPKQPFKRRVSFRESLLVGVKDS